MAKINKLPPDLEARLPQIRDEWMRVGLSTEPADRQEAEAAIDDVYAAANLSAPSLKIWLRSPMEGAKGAVLLKNQREVWDQVGAQVWDQVWTQVRDQVGDQVWKAGHGSHDANWIGLYSVFKGLLPMVDRLDGITRLARSCGWWWPFENAVILTDRPDKISRDAQFRLHSSDGHALRYRDGWGVYAWHGVRIPAWCIEQKNRITKETILAEENTEIRRAMCEIIGWDKAMTLFCGKVIHCDECLGLPRELREIDLKGAKVRLLKMTNGTIENGERRQFVEGVPLTVNTCHDAVAWQCGLHPGIYNEGVRT